jgi:hypothetical protein
MGEKMKKYVWYACYGSNLLEKRFNYYITGTNGITDEDLKIFQKPCNDKTLPLAWEEYVIPYPMYFACYSSKWCNKGVSFIDTSKKNGSSISRIYLITEDQFEHVQKEEGSLYSKKVSLGEYKGYEVYSFTNLNSLPRVKPSMKYENVLRRGLAELGKSEEEITNYLNECKNH